MRIWTGLVLVLALALAPGATAKARWEVDLGLGLVLLAKGDAVGAARSLKRSRRAIRRVREEHLDLAMAMLRTATSLTKSGKHREALVLADEATSLFEARRREDHPDLSTPQLARANILIRMKRWGEAESGFRSALRCMARDRRTNPETKRIALLGLASAMAEQGKGDLIELSQKVTQEFGAPGARPVEDDDRARQVRRGRSLLLAGRSRLAKKAAARSSAPDTPAAARQRIQAIRSQVEPVLARNRVGGAPPTRLAKRIREVDSLVKASSFFEVASYLVEADPPAQAEAEQLLVFHQDYAAAVEAASGILEGRFLSGLVRTKYLELLAQVRAEEGPVATLYETLRQRASGDGASSQVTAAAAADDPGPPPPVASKAPRRAPK